MRMIFKQPYKTITEEDKEDLESVELPPFTVITGKNGSGKTHLLEAAINGSISFSHRGIDSYGPVMRFDYRNFDISGQHEIEKRPISENALADTIHSIERQMSSLIGSSSKRDAGISNRPNEIIRHIIAQNKRACYQIIECLLKKEELEPSKFKDVILGDISEQEIENLAHYMSDLYDNLPPQAEMIMPILEEISLYEWFEAVKPKGFSFGKGLFNDWNLYVKERAFFMRKFIRESMDNPNLKNQPMGEIKERACAEFYKQHGKNPLSMFNDILSSYSCNGYSFEEWPDVTSNMEDQLIKGYIDKQRKLSQKPHFELSPLLKKGGVTIGIESLSSGEKTLLAVATILAEQKIDGARKTGVLLLDEVDAHLHPSMIPAFIRVIQEVFIKKYHLKVIMVSHAPTTIALAPRESIFIMHGKDEQKKRVEKVSNDAALEILTQGFATINKGLHLFDEIGRAGVSVITEGNNTQYIEKALELHELSHEVNIIKGAEGRTGVTQLKAIFQFISKIPHDKKVIFVFDCDVSGDEELRGFNPKNNTHVYIFNHNEDNTLRKKGIENLFSEEKFQSSFFNERKEEASTIRDLKKTEFMKHMLKHGTKDDFKNFLPLIEEIKKIANI